LSASSAMFVIDSVVEAAVGVVTVVLQGATVNAAVTPNRLIPEASVVTVELVADELFEVVGCVYLLMRPPTTACQTQTLKRIAIELSMYLSCDE